MRLAMKVSRSARASTTKFAARWAEIMVAAAVSALISGRGRIKSDLEDVWCYLLPLIWLTPDVSKAWQKNRKKTWKTEPVPRQAGRAPAQYLLPQVRGRVQAREDASNLAENVRRILGSISMAPAFDQGSRPQ